MAIIIHNMDKPESCIKCVFGVKISNIGMFCSLHPEQKRMINPDYLPDFCDIEQYDEEEKDEH